MENIYNSDIEIINRKLTQLEEFSIYTQTVTADDLTDIEANKCNNYKFCVLWDNGSNPFIQEIKNVLNGNKQFFDDQHREELKEWLQIHNSSQNDEEFLTPLNWIKIAIERFPLRLFIASNSIPSEALMKNSTFISKRICWISLDGLIDILNGNPIKINNIDNPPTDSNKEISERLQTWIHSHWIRHVAHKIRNISGAEKLVVKVDLGGSDSQTALKRPITLPQRYWAQLKPQDPKKDPLKESDIFLEQANKFSGEKQIDSNTFNIVYKRHDSVFSLLLPSCKWSEYFLDDLNIENPNTILFSGIISGAYPSWSLYEDFHDTTDKNHEYRISLSLAETALLRTLIVDERIQRWFVGIGEKITKVLQMGLLVGFFENPGKYGQQHEIAFIDERRDNKYSLNIKLSDDGSFKFSADMGKNYPDQFKYENIDVLYIHQGILDKWMKGKNIKDDKIKIELTKAVLDWKDKIPYIVITTGRGTPSNIPLGIKFSPFSAVENCLISQYFDKFLLLRMLF